MRDRSSRYSRRDFLLVGSGGLVSGVWLVSCSSEKKAPAWLFFTPEEGAAVESIADQLIPPDQDPGGKWAGVANYIDRQLAGFYRRFQGRYRSGLANLDKTAATLFGTNFVDLSADRQVDLLKTLESGTAPEGIWNEEPSSSFFNLVLDHCMQGFYGPPRHGGNRDFVGFKVVGLDYPQILGRSKPPAS